MTDRVVNTWLEAAQLGGALDLYSYDKKLWKILGYNEIQNTTAFDLEGLFP